MPLTLSRSGERATMTPQAQRHAEIRKLIIETNKTIVSLQRSLIRLEAELNHSAA